LTDNGNGKRVNKLLILYDTISVVSEQVLKLRVSSW